MEYYSKNFISQNDTYKNKRTTFTDEFQTLVGEPIPYRRLGFSSLRAFLKIVDGLETTLNDFGEQRLKINDSKISHIDRLIQKQKMDYSKTRVCS